MNCVFCLLFYFHVELFSTFLAAGFHTLFVPSVVLSRISIHSLHREKLVVSNQPYSTAKGTDQRQPAIHIFVKRTTLPFGNFVAL